MTSEHAVANAKANVLLYDANTNAWVASGSGQGLSKVSLYFNPSNNTYRIVGWRLQDRSVVINCSVPRSLKYHQARPTFHQWRDVKQQVYGLNFTSVEEAESFASAVQLAIENLVEIYRMQVKDKPGNNNTNPTSPQNYAKSQENINNNNNNYGDSLSIGQLSLNSNQSVPPLVRNDEPPSGGPKPPAPPPVPPPPPPPGNSGPSSTRKDPSNTNGDLGKSIGDEETPYDSPLAAQLKAFKQQKMRSSSVTSSNYGAPGELGGVNDVPDKPVAAKGGGDMMSDLQRVLAARRKAKESDDDTGNGAVNGGRRISSVTQPTTNQPPPASNNFATLRKNSSIGSLASSGGLRMNHTNGNDSEQNGLNDSTNGKEFITKADLDNFKQEIMSEFQRAINQMTTELIDAMRRSSVQ